MSDEPGPRDPRDADPRDPDSRDSSMDTDIESRLRAALDNEAFDLVPGERLGEIRDLVDHRSAGRLPRWLPPLGAAAAVAVIAVLAWFGLRPSTSTPNPAGTAAVAVPSSSAPSTSATSAGAPTASNTSGSPTGTASTSVPPGSVVVALPVYRVVTTGNGPAKYRLARDFEPVPLAAGATVEDKANAALAAAMSARTAVDGASSFLNAWPAYTTATYQALADPEIGISLSGPGSSWVDPDAAKLAVQALVWTVTAVTQKGDAPVRVGVASGGAIFNGLDPNVFKRPAADTAYTELSSVWVDAPFVGQTLAVGNPVVVRGQACTFEANVVWRLMQGSAVVKQGNTTASSACPTQSSWSVNLGTLPAGTYVMWAMDVSQKQGETALSVAVPFTVR